MATLGSINRPITVGLGVCALLLAFSVAFASSDTAQAHEDAAQHGGIQLTPEAPEWTSSGAYLRLEVRIDDEHPKAISIPDDEPAWAYKWFSYEHAENGEFTCSRPPFEVERRSDLEDWLEENGYGEDVYETQKNIFDNNGNFFNAFPQSDGSYKSSFTFLKRKSELARYIDGEATLAFCFEISYDDGSHASLSRLIVDFSDLENSQATTNLSPAGAASAQAGGTGGIGGSPTRGDLPETGLIEGLDDSLILTVAFSALAVVALASLKIVYSAKKHRRQSK